MRSNYLRAILVVGARKERAGCLLPPMRRLSPMRRFLPHRMQPGVTLVSPSNVKRKPDSDKTASMNSRTNSLHYAIMVLGFYSMGRVKSLSEFQTGRLPQWLMKG